MALFMPRLATFAVQSTDVCVFVAWQTKDCLTRYVPTLTQRGWGDPDRRGCSCVCGRKSQDRKTSVASDAKLQQRQPLRAGAGGFNNKQRLDRKGFVHGRGARENQPAHVTSRVCCWGVPQRLVLTGFSTVWAAGSRGGRVVGASES